MKPYYRRKRLWFCVFLLAAIYFCLVPSPLRISPETTGYTEPLMPNGDVDYFGVYEKTYIDKLSPPEDNGQRLLIAACGPRVLEQNSLMDAVPWEQLPTDERSKQWFEEKWVPLCEHMSIDPYARPRFLDSLDFYSFVNKQRKEEKLEYHELHEIWKGFVTAPWTAEEHPDIARWLEQRSPVLDLFGVAVRKPNFVCWRWRPDDNGLIDILLPDVQANRAFGRDLRVRITERLGRGDIDGAWYDVMSMFYLSRKHYIHDPIIVVNLVGIAIEGQGWEAAKLVLRHEKTTPEQLEQFAKDLASLTGKMVLDNAVFESNVIYVFLRHPPEFSYPGLIASDPSISSPGYLAYILPRFLVYLPIDCNIAGKRITEFNNVERRVSGDSAWNINPTVMKKYSGHRDDLARKKAQQLRHPLSLLRVPLIRTRSQLLADCLIATYVPALQAARTALDRSNAQLDLLRIAVALERYRSAHGEYPAVLDAVVPTYLDEVPLDPFTGRLSLVYKPEPKDGKPFVLYSLGPNGIDDGGTTSKNFAEGDIVY